MTNQTIEIKDLRDGAKRVSTEGKIVEKSEIREVRSKFGDCTYRMADAVLADKTGSIKLTLWNEQIEEVNVGDNVTIENGYVSSFKGEIQLNVGKFGKLTVG
jgi:replication factor A1